MVHKITSRMDRVVERLSTLPLPRKVTASLEEAAHLVASTDRQMNQSVLAAAAAERMKLEAAPIQGAESPDNAVVLTIPIPPMYTGRFPDPAAHTPRT